MILSAKTTSMMKFFHPTIFYFLQEIEELSNDKKIFQTIISPAGKSYDGFQKYCKSMQANCMSITSKD